MNNIQLIAIYFINHFLYVFMSNSKRFYFSNVIALIIFTVGTIKCYSQHPLKGVVEYTVERAEVNDTIKINNLNKELGVSDADKKLIKKMVEEPAYFILHFDGNESSYFHKGETLEIETNKKQMPNFLLTFGGGRSSNYYTNLKDSKIFAEKFAFGETITILYDIPKWEITGETKTIGEFNCYRAIKKSGDKLVNNLVVWFTPDIPVQFGPNLFIGLPGLVIEVISGNIRIVATKIDLNSSIKTTITKPMKSKRMSELEYNKLVEKVAKDFGF